MAKNFPFFKFIVTEWLTGDIVYESFCVQGLFVNICALYWQRDGKLTIDDINKRYKNPVELAELTDRFFSVNDGYISIQFLDEQLIDANHISKVNSQNGSLGGRPKITDRLATDNRPLSDRKAKKSKEEQEEELEEEKESTPAQAPAPAKSVKQKLTERTAAFKNELRAFVPEYGKELVQSFYDYWMEPNKSGVKMRWELERTWELSLRLKKWANNDSKFNNTPKVQEQPKIYV
jgi:hypothetical protein